MSGGENEPIEETQRKQRHSAKGFIRGSSLFLLGRLIAVVVNFLVGVLAVRYLVKSDFGAFTWAQSIAATGASTVLLGLNRATGRFAAIQHERKEYRDMFGTITLALAAVGGLGLLVVTAVLGLRDLLVYHVHSDLSVGLLMIMILLVPLDALDALFETLMAVFAKVRAIFFRRYVLAPLLKLAAVLLVMAFHGSVYMLAMAYVVGGFIGIALYVMMLRRVLSEQGLLKYFDPRGALPMRSLFGFSLPVMSTDVILGLETTMMVIILERFWSTEEVGELGAAIKVSVLCLLVFQNSKILYKPYASRLYARGDEAALRDLYWRSASWITIVTFPVFAVCLFLATPLVVFLFNKPEQDYSAAGVLLAILAIGKFVNSALGMNTYTLQVHARVWLILAINVVTAVLGLLMGLWLIPRHGAIGAATAGAATIITRNVLNQTALIATTRVGIVPRAALRLYGSVVLAVGVLGAVRLLTSSVYVLVPAVVVVSALLPRINRRYLDIADTFPELARIPLLGQYLGVQPRGAALTSTSSGSGPS